MRALAVVLCLLAAARATDPTFLDVNVIVLRLPDGSASSDPPYHNESPGTMALDADGNVTLTGDDAGSTLATSLTEADVTEIFEKVNELYAPADVRWNPTIAFVGPSTEACETQGGEASVYGKYKVRTHDYFVKYYGTINKKISKEGREERPINAAALLPDGTLQPGFNLLFIKYIGISSQGVVFTSPDWLHGGAASVAMVGEWSTKFTSSPVQRPNTALCGASNSPSGVDNCGIGLYYTVAHELGHLLGLGHTDGPSIMTSGGDTDEGSVFSENHIADIKQHIVDNGPSPDAYSSQASFEAAVAGLGMLPLPSPEGSAFSPGTVSCDGGAVDGPSAPPAAPPVDVPDPPSPSS